MYHRVEEFGELSIEAAQAYYEYGNALLVQQEENPSDNLLASADGNQADDIEVPDENEEGENEEGAENDEKEDDDLQISWENLDVR